MKGFYLQERIYTEKICKGCKKKFTIKGISVGKDNITIVRWHDKNYCEECGNKRKKEYEQCHNI